MQRFVRVKNNVATSETLPGIAESGMMKLIDEIATTDRHGK